MNPELMQILIGSVAAVVGWFLRDRGIIGPKIPKPSPAPSPSPDGTSDGSERPLLDVLRRLIDQIANQQKQIETNTKEIKLRNQLDGLREPDLSKVK